MKLLGGALAQTDFIIEVFNMDQDKDTMEDCIEKNTKPPKDQQLARHKLSIRYDLVYTVFAVLVVGLIFVLFNNIYGSNFDARLKSLTLREIFDLLKNAAAMWRQHERVMSLSLKEKCLQDKTRFLPSKCSLVPLDHKLY